LIFIGKQDIIASRERLAGVESVANALGMPVHFVSCSLNYISGLKLGRELVLPACDGPLGLIAANDWLALGLHAGLSSGILGMPQKKSDVHIVSFDGLPMMDDVSIGIASLAVPLSTIAIDAVAELRRLHQSPMPVGRVVCYPLSWRTGNNQFGRENH
jgi:DNA-binding LacI/PurR family transcriptional regulator